MGSIKFCYLDIQQDSSSEEQVNDEIESNTFDLQYHINLLLQFPPNRHQFNFLSIKKQLNNMDRSCLTDETLVRNLLCSRFLSSVPIKPEDIDSMIKTITSTAKLLEAHETNAARKVIPLVMSVRLVFEQEFNAALNQQWRSVLGKPLAEILKYPATRSVTRTLDKVVFDKGLCFIDDCAICCQEFSEAEEITRLPCLHTYHGNCITEWLKDSCFCPICRFPLPVCRIPETLYPFKTKRVLQASTRRSPRMSSNFYRDQFRLKLSLRECGF